ncbi:hypothetical protein [Sorangium sp. So ce176]|uniref:hypothetical protein n=1 Tax=Sorangium sp. So ce176 TaxID=3133286 RepID=UPI003F5E04C4
MSCLPTVGTYVWDPHPGCTDTPEPGAIGAPPAKVVAGDYPNWTPSPVRTGLSGHHERTS